MGGLGDTELMSDQGEMGLAAALCSLSICPLCDVVGCSEPLGGAGGALPAPAPSGGPRLGGMAAQERAQPA